jgi:hypothetical protein
MDRNKARQLGEKAFDLLDLCCEYEGRFRRGDPPTIQSPDEAWRLWEQIYDK